MQFFAATLARDDEPRLLQLLQVLHDPEPAHLKSLGERVQGLAVLAEQLIEQRSPGGIGQRLEYLVHPGTIGDHLVTCQGQRSQRALDKSRLKFERNAELVVDTFADQSREGEQFGGGAVAAVGERKGVLGG